ncbi:MAG: SGNH/GDSL hydrolase family protein [Candidatus Omnitrophica bacterium]|nr:SGNH/GDSL hydrolase family protein [Candidatus Omnitrophota bacterium]
MFKPSKSKVFTLILILILFCFVEITAFIFLLILSKTHNLKYIPINDRYLTGNQVLILENILENKMTYNSFDALLGWSVQKNGYKNKYMFANSQGLRANREYTFKKPENILRILCFGDSFTHGEGVTNASTWPAFLEKSKNVEALNFGVAGGGSDMAYLRYLRDGSAYEADIVILGIMTENIGRHVMTFWPYYQSFYGLSSAPHVIPKPRYVIKDNKLSLIKPFLQTKEDIRNFKNDPAKYLPLIGQNDFYYNKKYKIGFFDFLPSFRLAKVLYHNLKHKNTIRMCYYKETSEAVQITYKIIDSFVKDVKRNGNLPILLMLPAESDIEDSRQKKPRGCQHILDYLQKNNYPHIDFTNYLEQHASHIPLDQLIQGHYSPVTNKLVAQAILTYVMDLLKPTGVK